jgi:hypothetical protein
MQAVKCYPIQRATLQRHGREDGKAIFQPFWYNKAAMSKQAMITNGNPDVLTKKPKDKEYSQSSPGELEECGNGTGMKEQQRNGEGPIHLRGLLLPDGEVESFCGGVRLQFSGNWSHMGKRFLIFRSLAK